ncbi:DUF4282 domain-containing protein [Kaistia adipata]|uniref:DUF4282 domain-containing protein n=1 Tax=Kaistia adipata TaxID=166954 RepID=UPI000415C338|nr:DUF4282 domain-containing protein [Kaistia adipata]
MISFLDLFKWDRFVATSFIELLFWLLTAIAVLLGVAGVVGGVVQVAADPAGGLLAIALSILGGFAGIVMARTLCEAVIMLFRVNENLMDIRDGLAPAAERHAPAPHAAVPPVEPVEPARSFADVLELALAEPEPVSAMPPQSFDLDWQEPLAPEPGPVEPKPVEPKSPETSSLEARLAEIRARREGGAAASARAPSPAPVSHPEKSPSTGGRGGLAEPVVAADPATAAAGFAPEVKPTARPAAEAKRAESKKPDDARRTEETKRPDEKKAAGKDAAAAPVEPAPVADTLEDEITKALAREVEKPKAG